MLAAEQGLEQWCRRVEAGRLELTVKRVPLARLPAPMRILHIADFHIEDPETYGLLDRAFAMGLAAKPELVCITGDFITDEMVDFASYVKCLRRLSAACPTYAITGNHDGGVWSRERKGYQDSTLVRKLLDESGIECLHNRSVRVRGAGDAALELTGVADFWSGDARPDAAFAESRKSHLPNVVMAHNPDYKEDLAGYPWDLLLAGHTHGGQWRLPLIGWPPYVPVKDRRYLEGLRPWNDRQIHVTRGVGAILRSRLNCPPEVSLLDLMPAEAPRA
jgi:predicted MPP superfamily phosphohydrolase